MSTYNLECRHFNVGPATLYEQLLLTSAIKTRRSCYARRLKTTTGWAKKRGDRLMTIILSILNRFTNFFTGRFLSKFAVKWILKIPPHLAYVSTLPCLILMSAKQAISDKLQGSVATYLMYGGVVNNQL